MTNIDQFESAFRAADKQTFKLEPPAIERGLILTDLGAEDGALLAGKVQDWLRPVLGEISWERVDGDGFATPKDVLDLVEAKRPQLVVTYRNLKSEAWQWPFSLGEHLDVLCGAADTPVLVLPHPEAGRALEHAGQDTNSVLAMTDHLAGDARLVNYAVKFTQDKGELRLVHIEDQRVFDRYLDVISKLPEIDTETARNGLLERLLKEPADYIDSITQALAGGGRDLQISSLIKLGQHLGEYRELIEAQQVDLVVMAARDEDQLAMHGLAYPLAVELRQVPLLLL